MAATASSRSAASAVSPERRRPGKLHPMPGPSYILIHVFGTVRDELDREDKGKRTYSAWLREYVAEQPQRLTEIARLLDLLSENG